MLDTRFSFYIQACAETPDSLEVFAKKTVEGLKKPEAQKFADALAKSSTWVEISGKKRLLFKIDPNEQGRYFEKIIRGIFYHLFKRPSGGRVVSCSKNFASPAFNYNELITSFGPTFTDSRIYTKGVAHNPDIFQYRYIHVVDGNRSSFAILMTFYRNVEVLGIITNITHPP